MMASIKFKEYIEEIELIHGQNRVECDLYSIIAQMMREGESSKNVSIRDVSTRRTSDFSKVFKSKYSGFPDFVVRERVKSNVANNLGAIEVKYTTIKLDKHLEQLKGHVKFYKKVVFTNGLEWRFYDNDVIPKWTVIIGKLDGRRFIWENEDKWNELQNKLKKISWID